MRKKLITMFQTPTVGVLSKQKGPTRESNFSIEALESAYYVACELETHILTLVGVADRQKRIDKFRSLYQILDVAKPGLREEIMDGQIPVHKFVRMNKDEFLSTEEKKLRDQ
jgi:hypothetical protein